MTQGMGQYIGGKVLGAVLIVASAIIVIWYWRLTPEARADMWGVVRGTLIWAGLVAVLPWASFFVPVRVMRAENNLVSATMLVGYLAADVGFAFYLTSGRMGDAWQTGTMLFGFLCAVFYNFVVCDFIAERYGDTT